MCFSLAKFYISLKENVDLILQVNYSIIVNALTFRFMKFIMLILIKIFYACNIYSLSIFILILLRFIKFSDNRAW